MSILRLLGVNASAALAQTVIEFAVAAFSNSTLRTGGWVIRLPTIMLTDYY